jgi:superfamily II DNA/RNA helicase
MGMQLRELRTNPSIVFGTPGRIKDHLERGSLNLSGFTIAVLDEVDRMLDMGFVSDITELLSHTAQPRQSLFFSATMDSRVESLIGKFMRDPITISVVTGVTSDNVEQNIVRYETSADKLGKLHDLLISEGVSKALVFDDTQRSVERLSTQLQARGFAADAIHGGKSQGQRQRALRRFKESEVNVLVATDVAARGIDVSDISHVINYSQPNSYDDYVHRVGRAGRAGRKGFAFTFVD